MPIFFSSYLWLLQGTHCSIDINTCHSYQRWVFHTANESNILCSLLKPLLSAAHWWEMSAFGPYWCFLRKAKVSETFTLQATRLICPSCFYFMPFMYTYHNLSDAFYFILLVKQLSAVSGSLQTFRQRRAPFRASSDRDASLS